MVGARGFLSNFVLIISCFVAFNATAAAQIVRQPDGTLHAVHPSGGQRGTTVAVEFASLQGLDNAKGVLIDGAPGVTVKDFKPTGANKAQATFVIAPDAAPGPRQVRVVGGAHGLTTYRAFYVGTMPEVVEKEPNNAPDVAQLVTLPVVVNGKVDPALDIDCYSFDAKAGQRVVAAVHAHGMDSRFRTRGNNGFLDTSLELLDAKGKVLASAEDVLGLDPVIEYVIPTEGRYTLRVQAMNFEGAPGATYRLTVGDVAIPAAVFPAGAKRGTSVEVAFTGFNVPQNARKTIVAPGAANPWQTVQPDFALTNGHDLPFLTGEYAEVIETEPNDAREKANVLPFKFPADGVTVNGRFDKPNDADWYRVSLKKGEGFVLEIAAQRHLRSPVDTVVAVFDAAGKQLADNDDGAFFSGQCEHDYPSADSRLEFTAPADGEYFIRVTDQSGVTGPRAIYRLTVAPLVPDFRLHQWPDAVPVWGPGTSSCFVIQVQRWGGLKGDISLRIEGLPPGWKGSAGVAGEATYYAPRQGLNQKVLLTITAPADAKVGDVAAFRVVGRAERGGKVIEREAYPQTLLGSSHTDRMHLRYSQVSRAAVAPPLDSRLETPTKEITVVVGEKVTIPVKVIRTPGMTNPIGVTVDGETLAVGTGWRTPLTLKEGENEIQLTLEVTRERKPGTYGIVVSRSWAADLRAGRPGPCTELIIIHVKPQK
jgi:hypothetical protein